MVESIETVALLSLEPWDQVWRRNQHLASGLVSSCAARRVLYISPPVGGAQLRSTRATPLPGIDVVTPPLLFPRRYGGHRLLAAWLRRAVRDADVVWVNDPVAGRGLLAMSKPLVYDVTDDWRCMPQRDRQRAAIVAAEDALARRATTVVCSPTLAERWKTRYGVDATLIPNAVDVDAIRTASPRVYDDHLPAAVYVGTLHENRLDVGLVEALARDRATQVHLVGPDHLQEASRARLVAAGVTIHGAVSSAEVPAWLTGADVLICPHLVDEFTMSLDAIKAHEYLATDEPIVATASCGFQSLTAPGLTLAGSTAFVAAVRAAVGTGPFDRGPQPPWADSVMRFASVLRAAL